MLFLYQWNSIIKVTRELIAQETLQCCFLSNVPIRVLDSSRLQLYLEFF